jgi:DNA mismatch repair protein MutS
MQILKSTYQILPRLINQGAKLTPMMEQFHDIKSQYPEALLFFRMGDFFELFFEDAILAAKHLNITLTTRGQIHETSIPMAGIPHHAAANYVDKLTHIGLRIVICDQIENPKFAKGIVKRAVVQICSPGLPYDIDRSHTLEQHFVATAIIHKKNYLLSFVDFVHGDFFVVECQSHQQIFDYLKLYRPKEFLTYLGQFNESQDWENLWDQINTTPTFLSEEYFNAKNTVSYQEKVAPYLKYDHQFKANSEAQSAVNLLCYYLQVTQKINCAVNLKKLRWVKPNEFMNVTSQTLVGLEILPKNQDQYRQSLLGWADHTKTSMGYRLLKEWFLYPLKNEKNIIQRQQHIKACMSDWNALEKVRNSLEHCRDIPRILAKAASGKISSSDMINLAKAYSIANTIDAEHAPILKNLRLHDELKKKLGIIADEIQKALNEEIGATLEKGNLFKPGYNQQRDELAQIHLKVAHKIQKLEEKYKQKFPALNSLRIRSNNISGHYIEVSKVQAKSAPKDFERLQTLTNVERFLSPELKKIEQEMLKATDQLLELDLELFKYFQTLVINTTEDWIQLADWISHLDVYQSFAYLAEKENLVLPEFNQEQFLELKGLWHPLLKDKLKEHLITHNISFNSQKFFALITGPNMAGKTTVMREVALSSFLAQLGSLVPASMAKLPIFDALYSRLGANDDILNGQSTFMVEMSEASEILRSATSHSLILIDEIGRGTSTHDGLSIAQAIMQYLCQDVRAITLFSTHYHELIHIAEEIPEAINLTIKTEVRGKDVVFLYEIIEGGAKESFGLHVAKLAGLPQKVLKNADRILENLKLEEHNTGTKKEIQLEMLQFIESAQENNFDHLKVIETIKKLNLNETTPINALLKLQEIQKTLN